MHKDYYIVDGDLSVALLPRDDIHVRTLGGAMNIATPNAASAKSFL